MKGCRKWHAENEGKWVLACRQAYHEKGSGMSIKDLEKEVNSYYEKYGSNFNNLIIFNEVMCKHLKWDLTTVE